MLAAIVASRAWSYLLFHSLAELFSIIIAASYFLVAWHTRKYNQVPSLVTLGFDASASIREQAEILREAAAGKAVRLEIPAPGEVMVAADRDMLDTVLRNLLQNAVKFSPAGACVSVRTERNGAVWQISVDDTGIGMDADDLSKLFKVDGHLHRIGTNGERGVGFGLILSMEFIRLMYGRLDVTSVPGKGSSFRLSLPADDRRRLVR